MSVLIYVQIVCKGCQQMTEVAASRQRVIISKRFECMIVIILLSISLTMCFEYPKTNHVLVEK